MKRLFLCRGRPVNPEKLANVDLQGLRFVEKYCCTIPDKTIKLVDGSRDGFIPDGNLLCLKYRELVDSLELPDFLESKDTE